MKRSNKRKKDLVAKEPEHMGIRRVKIGFPQWMIDRMDREAEMIGITRQTIIKFWIAKRLDALAKKIG